MVTMAGQLPFPIRSRTWSELSERERGVFCFDDDDLPLPATHAAQIALLDADHAKLTSAWLFSALPSRWPRPDFTDEITLRIDDKWNSVEGVQTVRQCLHGRGITYARQVYLIYDWERVVQMPWKLVVRYWDAVASLVGVAMITMDHTRQWACCFHHEDVIIFGTFKRR